MGLGMPGGGLGALKSAEANAVGQIEAKKHEVSSSISAQQEQAVTQTKESIDNQISNFKERKKSIVNSLGQLRGQLEQIPDVPDERVQSARERIKSQINQLKEALNQINTAINMAAEQKGQQIGRIKEKFQESKESVLGKLHQQKVQILARFAGQKMQLMQQMKMYQARRGMEGGRPKG